MKSFADDGRAGRQGALGSHDVGRSGGLLKREMRGRRRFTGVPFGDGLRPLRAMLDCRQRRARRSTSPFDPAATTARPAARGPAPNPSRGGAPCGSSPECGPCPDRSPNARCPGHRPRDAGVPPAGSRSSGWSARPPAQHLPPGRRAEQHRSRSSASLRAVHPARDDRHLRPRLRSTSRCGVPRRRVVGGCWRCSATTSPTTTGCTALAIAWPCSGLRTWYTTRARTTTCRPRCARPAAAGSSAGSSTAAGGAGRAAAGVQPSSRLVDLLYPVLGPLSRSAGLAGSTAGSALRATTAHHAVNDRYLDRNYGGILIVWGPAAGTFALEDDAEPCVYGGIAQPAAQLEPGVGQPAGSCRPVPRFAWHTRRWSDKLRVWFEPPGWRPPTAARFPAAVRNPAGERYDPPVGAAHRCWRSRYRAAARRHRRLPGPPTRCRWRSRSVPPRRSSPGSDGRAMPRARRLRSHVAAAA